MWAMIMQNDMFIQFTDNQLSHEGSPKDLYEVRGIPYGLAMDLVTRYHYLKRSAPSSKAFGLFYGDEIIGVANYGVPPSSTLLKGICGEDEAENVYELNRLWIKDGSTKNAESFFVSSTIKQLDREIIVSFAEIEQGHVGYVYQACNFHYCGLSNKFKDPVVKGLEHQHHCTYAHGMTMEEVKEKYGEENVSYVERPRKHRYIIFNAPKIRKKQLLKKLKYEIKPYPKGENNAG
jgi:hypothetical protein